jgi:superfamily II DNA or RNA helicase
MELAMVSVLIIRLIAMRQTLGRERKLAEFKQTFSIADFNLVVVDEAHHSPANS